MKFIAIKTDDGTVKGKLAFYCRMLHVSRQGFYKYLSVKDRPWKYQTLADTMLEIHAEDICNDTYGRCLLYTSSIIANAIRSLTLPAGLKDSIFTIKRAFKSLFLL